jgi:aspartate kinase
MKFGGSLTADARAIRRLAQIVVAESLAWRHMAVVVSAMGGATDQLARALDQATDHNGAGYRQTIAGLRAQHAAVIDLLFPQAAVRADLLRRLDRWLYEALSICDTVAMRRESMASPRERDATLVVGERLVAEIAVALLHADRQPTALIDSTAWLITDEHFQNANPITEAIEERVERVIRPALAAKLVVVTPGFAGMTQRGEPTTLGRGGSDYTATLLAAALNADEVWMWSGVDGIMSADPSLVPDAHVIDTLSYTDIRELSYFGVRVLHPRAVEPLLPAAIPMRVRNPWGEHAGSLIRAQAAEQIRAVSAIDGLLLTTSQPDIDLQEFLGQIIHLVGQSALGPVIVAQSQTGVALVFVVPTSEGPGGALLATNKIAAHLSGALWTVRQVKVIAALGLGGVGQSVSQAMALTESPILAHAYGPGDRRIFAVAPEDAPFVIRQLHRLI